MVLNLVVAVILEGFEDSSLDKELEIVNLAIDTWKKYDPKYKLKLDVAKCELLVDEIENAVLTREEKKIRDHIQLSNKELDFLSQYTLSRTMKCNFLFFAKFQKYRFYF